MGRLAHDARPGPKYAKHGCYLTRAELMKKILVIALFSLAPAFFAVAHTGNTNFSGDVAHSGGTDKNGCHRDHKRGGRHCH